MGSWSYEIMKPLLKRTFPNTQIIYDNYNNPQLVIRSHFEGDESLPKYDCPYINWSGESFPVKNLPNRNPLVEINTVITERENEIWFPHLVTEVANTERPLLQVPKKWCCVYANSNNVIAREQVFQKLRQRESTCYAIGRCSYTNNNPIELSRSDRSKNSEAFQPFAFTIAMENKIAPKYITEKIGYAFNAGTVPIYWGDSSIVSFFFNQESYIDVNNFKSPEAVADFVVNVWQDKQKLQKYLDAPLRLNKNLSDYEAVRTEYRSWQKPFINILRDNFPDLS
jgi:hypothetical protein